MIRLSGRLRSSLIIGLQGIRARKLRTLLSMVSLFLGVLAVVVVQAGASIAEHALLSDLELTSGPAAKPPISTISPGDVLKSVSDAFASADAWAALPPREVDKVVSLAERQPSDGVVVHPLGALSARQRVLPLGQTIDRFGTSQVAPTSFTLNGFQIGVSAATTRQAEDLHDDFPPGQFKALSDDERVARPAFESMASGGRVAAKLFRLPTTRPGGYSGGGDYDEAVVDVEPTTGSSSAAPLKPNAAIPGTTLHALAGGGAARIVAIPSDPR